MKPLPDGVKLKKVPTPPSQHFVTTSYAVFLNGKAVGHVRKFVQPTGNRATPKRVTPTSVCWGWDRPGAPEDAAGYDTRGDAIGWLLRSLDVPRETSNDQGES